MLTTINEHTARTKYIVLRCVVYSISHFHCNNAWNWDEMFVYTVHSTLSTWNEKRILIKKNPNQQTNQYYQMSNLLKIANIDRIACWLSSRWFSFLNVSFSSSIEKTWERTNKNEGRKNHQKKKEKANCLTFIALNCIHRVVWVSV